MAQYDYPSSEASVARFRKQLENARKAGRAVEHGPFWNPYSKGALGELLQEDIQKAAPIGPQLRQARPSFGVSGSFTEPTPAPVTKPKAPTKTTTKTTTKTSPKVNPAMTVETPQISAESPIQEEVPLQSYINPKVEQLPMSGRGQTGMTPQLPPINIAIPEESSIWEQLRDAFSSVPQRGDYEPSRFRKIAAGIAGGASGFAHGPEVGFQTSQNIINRPYEEAYQDWQTRTGALTSQANIDLARQKAETGGLSDIASLLRAQGYLQSLDPDYKANVKQKELEVTAPFKEEEFEREQGGRREIQNMITERQKLIAELQTKGRSADLDKRLTADWNRMKATLSSRENIARLNREAKTKSDQAKLQRIPVNQQYLAQQIANNDIAKMSTAIELENIFRPVKDNNGNTIGYEFKPINEVPDSFKEIYNQRLAVRDTVASRMSRSGFSPTAGEQEEEIEDEDEYEIEEIDE